ncbi:MAG: hypothetical protein NVS1B13_09360 [Flavisolibacter sp.]
MISKTYKIYYQLLWILVIFLFSCFKNFNGTPGSIFSKPFLYGVTFPDLFQKAVLNKDTALFYLPYGSQLSFITTHIETDATTKSSVPKDGVYDYRQPLSVTLTNGGTTKKYYIIVKVAAVPDTAVRGVWVTNVGSLALSTPQDLELMVNTVATSGLNTIFADVFNKNQTLHPSAVLQKNTPAGTQVQMFGSGWDPLQILIEKSHAKGIKVIPWFEYGFISHFKGIAHPILEAHPDWASIDYYKNTTVRNDFTWLNGFHPEVQKFMLDLIMEVVNKYDVDGIQCDDHLPAMPLNSGYDTATAALYKRETSNDAPSNSSDPQWMQWRADKLTAFARVIYKNVKAAKPHCAVCFAPGPLGWSLQNNMADWDAWIRLGICDVVSPLLYRSESAGLNVYTDLIDKDIKQIINKYPGSVNKYYPGIMVKNGSCAPSDDYLATCLQYNRSKLIKGEVFWYFEGLRSNSKVYQAFYPTQALFPSF